MYIGSSNHIGGLASGMDIDSHVERLMEAHRRPVDSLRQDKQELQWKQEEFRDINKKLRSFQDLTFDMRLEKSFDSKNASSSNESVLTASAGNTAPSGIHEVSVKNLARGVTKGSQEPLNDAVEDGSVLSLKEHLSLDVDSLEFKIVGEEKEDTDNGERKSATIKLDTTTDTIYNLVEKINNEDLGIEASYDSNNNRFFMHTESTGTDQGIGIENDSENFISGDGNALGMDIKIMENAIDPDNDNIDENGVYIGQDAEYSFGDMEGLTSSTNNVSINDISMQLKDTGNVNINVEHDTDKVVENITNFIDNYNETIGAINEKVDEIYYRDYQPLTDDQRQELTDDQIDKWEEKARSGLLRNDPILSNVANKMRMTMSAIVPDVNGEYDRLSDIGIETTSDWRSDQLVVDEDKLRSAVENNPDSVKELFRKNPDSEEYEDMGLARRLHEDIRNGISRISDKAGSSNDYSLVDDSFLGNEIDRIDDRIETKEERLQRTEERYWDQFTQMEKAIQRMNQQSMWLQQQFGGGMGM